ncbi:cadherin-13-like isoform X1 [Seriola lalandi dorsalis]|uniref:cadherin-13-like isoform X1 n=1 Tax=Seriola lalandi dorsalis TaxID=1841481 RepID=UPI000C6FC38A|nr:cadherin-13-like isoform X1 [Seriola lalandi dorsalis]
METIQLCLFTALCLGIDGSSSEILQRQKRNWIIDSFSIDEGYGGSYPYSLGTVKVEKTLTLFQIHGQGVDEDPKGILHINNRTGEITVHGPVDYETYQELKLVFLALDRDSRVIDTRLGIEISVIDANDHPPKFDREIYMISIKESTLQGTNLITIQATDSDNGNNKLFTLRIVSTSYKSEEVEFYITQMAGTQTGTISFKGCLDHEKAEKHIIIVEAKDRGDKLQLSSSCTVIINIEDGNNHSPEITGQRGPGKVKEGEENVLVSRLQVKDEDGKGTDAWRVKYQIQGEAGNYFRISTDPDTNEGLLYVKKHLNYEDGPVWNVTVSVENELPYYSCRVESKSAVGLWKVTTISAASGGGGGGGGGAVTGLREGSSIYQLTVSVEDVNEPPIFDEFNKEVPLFENIKGGQYLVTFTARDPDVSSKNTFVYIKGKDPAGWVTVDPKTGKVTTSKMTDRESVFVNQSIYVVNIYAVDDGKPPMTGTATLTIHIKDENDNVPSLTETIIEMCQSDRPSWAKITALDLDEEPYSGPFSFKLHGDVDGKWKIDPLQGHSVNLVKEMTVHSGHHELVVEVSDAQGAAAVHNLSVTVCNCLDTEKPNCHNRKSITSSAGPGAFFIIIFSILFLATMLLLAGLVTCKKQFIPSPDYGLGQYLKNCNTEEPGTDCKVAIGALNEVDSQTVEQIETKQVNHVTAESQGGCIDLSQRQNLMEQTFSRNNSARWVTAESQGGCIDLSQRQNLMEQTFSRNNSAHWSKGASSTMRMKQLQGQSMYKTWGGHSKYSVQENIEIRKEILLQILNKRLYSLQAPGVELCDYTPHVYAEEGETRHNFELDAISISDISFDPDMDLDLRFSTLASICMPNESTVYSTKTSYVTEKLKTGTLIQVESHETKMNTPPYL